jgi:hypothetical protein
MEVTVRDNGAFAFSFAILLTVFPLAIIGMRGLLLGWALARSPAECWPLAEFDEV